MDIHLRNLAPETSQKALKRYLRPRLANYGVIAFECIKLKSKRYAFLTIPDSQKAQSFLSDHSVPGRLHLGNPLTAEPSRRPPDPQLVQSLASRAQEITSNGAPPKGEIAKRFSFLSFSCGILTYEGSELIFQSEFTDPKGGVVVFGTRAFTVTTPEYDPNSTDQTTKLDFTNTHVQPIMLTAKESCLTFVATIAPKAFHMPKRAADLLQRLESQLALGKDIEKPLRVRGVNDAHEKVFATCLAYRLRLDPSDFQQLQASIMSKSSLPSALKWHVMELRRLESFHAQMFILKAALFKTAAITFDIRFQLQRLVQNCFLPPSTVIEMLPEISRLLTRYGSSPVAQAIRRLARDIPYVGPEIDVSEFTSEKLLGHTEYYASKCKAIGMMQYTLANRYRHLRLVHQALVTPAGIYLEGPELEPVNRVLRQYSDHVSTSFLRVKFKDEDGGPIQFDFASSLVKIHQHWFMDVLKNGIDIAGRTFSFLGFSNSSLRDQSVWFSAPFWQGGQYFTSWTIVQGLGDFTQIRSPAKCAARIGQAFSDTVGGAVSTDLISVIKLPDVKRCSRVFSDGCGTISKELLERIWVTYGRRTKPTVFQIRYAGAKGMVSLDRRLKGGVLAIRDSMDKFSSQFNAIEICDAARRPLPFYLNRPLVKILEDLGVSTMSFLELQQQAVDMLRKACRTPRDAASFLERSSVGRGSNFPALIVHLDSIGIQSLEDSFIRHCVEHVILVQLRLIKYKARILVPGSFTLFGVMDESDTLDEGQIFCRADGNVQIGRAAITRSPAMHPGDVQLVQAVAVPDESILMELDNCVVFSQRGQRDLASQLSGGDLDGDLFNIIFDKTLRPKKTFPPANYHRARPIDLAREMTAHDIKAWFLNFMANDQLGRIASLHLQLADYLEAGTTSDACLHLAELHSTAVDFQKTGIPVEGSKIPKAPKCKPDFMAPDPRLLRDTEQPKRFEANEYIPSDDDESPQNATNPDVGKPRTLYYPSQKALGRMYRSVNEGAILQDIESQMPATRGPTVSLRLWKYIERETQAIQWMHLCDWARGVREEYEELVAEAMVWNSPSPRTPLTELEVFTGEILGKGGAIPSRETQERARSMKDQFNDGLAYITRRIVHGSADSSGDIELDTMISEPDRANTSIIRDKALERSIACLYVSMEEGERWGIIGNRKLQSFRYVAGIIALRETTLFQRRNATQVHGINILHV